MKDKFPISYTLVLLFLLSLTVASFSQEKTKISPYIQLQYFKNSNDSSYLLTTLTYSFNRMELPIAGKEISFYSEAGSEKLLGKGMTDDKGIVKYILENGALQVDKEGSWNFKTDFQGNDSIDAASSAISVKDVKLEMELSEADSIKTLLLNAISRVKGKDVPVAGEVVMVYVPRMFSLLPVAEATLDDKGSASVEFPGDIPGDKEGNITILARFVENPTYGNVERKVVAKWGMPAILYSPVTHRALWTKTPPRWMIITLSILLAGVWGHYLFAIISLFRIKRDANKNNDLKM